jgi:hypothetical protein
MIKGVGAHCSRGVESARLWWPHLAAPRRVGVFFRAFRWGGLMTGTRRRICLSWVAFAAIGGVLSTPSKAVACTSQEVSPSAQDCCVLHPTPHGDGQGPVEAVSRPQFAGQLLASPTSGACLGLPLCTCECRRAGDPAAPSPKPVSRPSQQRSDQAPSEGVPLAAATRPAITLVRLLPPTRGLPKSPLYLRIEHLII